MEKKEQKKNESFYYNNKKTIPITIKTAAATLLIVSFEIFSEINFPKNIAMIERMHKAIIDPMRTAIGLNLVANKAAAI